MNNNLILKVQDVKLDFFILNVYKLYNNFKTWSRSLFDYYRNQIKLNQSLIPGFKSIINSSPFKYYQLTIYTPDKYSLLKSGTQQGVL